MAPRISRREFVAASVAAGAAVLLPSRRVLGANDRVNLAMIGCGDKGGAHVDTFKEIDGVQVVAVCDPDLQRMAEVAKKIESGPAQHQDYRRVLDDKDIDAVVIAAPNHWHAPMTMLACQAGKHVYVEKPVSHCMGEGRQMVAAARKYDRIVQAGTQHRSDASLRELAADIKAGMYGKVQWVHCEKLGARESIGKVTEPTPVPAHIDYNLWAGPASMTPVMRKSFHYDWHWQWSWGDGEMGNWAIHYLDDTRNILDLGGVPRSVVAAGNRFAWDDDGQTPNMHMALLDFDGLPVVVDVRNLPDLVRPEGKPVGGKGGAVYQRMRHGNIFMCEGAVVRFARGGGKSYDKDTGQEIKHYSGTGGAGHDVNFIEAVRSGRREDLHAEIEVSHLSTILCHQANISYRMGATANPDQVRAAVSSHPDALETLADMMEQLDGLQVDLDKTPFVLGPRLEFDAEHERFVGEHADAANAYLTYDYREPFAKMLQA